MSVQSPRTAVTVPVINFPIIRAMSARKLRDC